MYIINNNNNNYNYIYIWYFENTLNTFYANIYKQGICWWSELTQEIQETCWKKFRMALKVCDWKSFDNPVVWRELRSYWYLYSLYFPIKRGAKELLRVVKFSNHLILVRCVAECKGTSISETNSCRLAAETRDIDRYWQHLDLPLWILWVEN